MVMAQSINWNPLGTLRRPTLSTPLHPSLKSLPVDSLKFSGQKSLQPSYDLVIVGGGLAGMTAAYEAHKAGVKTLVLEGEDRLGGNAKTGYRRLEAP